MSDFGFRLGLVNDGLSPVGLLELGQYIAGHIDAGSGGVIKLQPKGVAKLPYSMPPQTAVSPLRLHQWLAQLLGGPTVLPVSDIGLLFAHSYAPFPEIFGLMFDLGFKTPEDTSGGLFTQVPRQGCAIFLGAIQAARSDAAYSQQVAFTGVHEVGHIFNLTHQANPLTFMAQSRLDGPYGPAAYFFGPNHRKWLARCGQDPDVTPGGSPFLDLGYLDKEVAAHVERKFDLRAELSSQEFWPFEPVMLNLSLSLKPGFRSARVPAQLDPGYSNFRIVIEGPDGERRLYRAPLRFCAQTPVMTLRAGEPFKRDLPVFGQAGGYTFSEPGRHRLWVDFDLTARSTLRSNVCEFEVLPAKARSGAYARAKAAFGRAGAARALFYREGKRTQLQSLAQEVEGLRPVSSAITKYLCARAVTAQVGRKWVKQQLLEALDCGLPAHQEARANGLVRELEAKARVEKHQPQ